VVINHGSTGEGTDPTLFRNTWHDLGLADFLNERGWLVAFPQRRGRGKSDGLYDEGFSPERARMAKPVTANGPWRVRRELCATSRRPWRPCVAGRMSPRRAS
jgi:hypothetical protein